MRWFTSDTHFGHANIIRYCNRPFDSVGHMDREMLKRWNEKVKPDDLVYFLGDFSMSEIPLKTFLPKLNGTKFLIHGNHDFTHPHHKKSRSPESHLLYKTTCLQHGFDSVMDYAVLHIKGIRVKLSHFTYPTPQESEHDYKYAKYQPIDDGAPLLHGHIHQTAKIQRSTNKTLMINVGVDIWDFYPVSEDQILEILKKEGY